MHKYVNLLFKTVRKYALKKYTFVFACISDTVCLPYTPHLNIKLKQVMLISSIINQESSVQIWICLLCQNLHIVIYT